MPFLPVTEFTSRIYVIYTRKWISRKDSCFWPVFAFMSIHKYKRISIKNIFHWWRILNKIFLLVLVKFFTKFVKIWIPIPKNVQDCKRSCQITKSSKYSPYDCTSKWRWKIPPSFSGCDDGNFHRRLPCQPIMQKAIFKWRWKIVPSMRRHIGLAL